jgi:putative transposon-encoded protein
MKVVIEKETDEIDAEEILKNKQVKRFGDGGAHILVPKKHLGSTATILIHAPVGSWAEHMRKSIKNKKAKK